MPIHPAHCRCPKCRPIGPGPRQTPMQIIGGFLIGVFALAILPALMIMIADWLAGAGQ